VPISLSRLLLTAM